MLTLLAFLRSPIARYLGFALGLAVAAGSLYMVVDHRGYARCQREHQVALAAHIQRAQAQAVEIALQDAEISESYEIWRTRTVTKVEEVIREIPADCAACRLSPNGLSLINAARSGGLPSAQNPGQPDAALSAPPSVENRNVPGIRRGNIDGHTSVQRLQGEALPSDPGREGTGI